MPIIDHHAPITHPGQNPLTTRVQTRTVECLRCGFVYGPRRMSFAIAQGVLRAHVCRLASALREGT